MSMQPDPDVTQTTSQETTPSAPTSEDTNQQSGGASSTVDWAARYKGLQASTDRRIADLTAQVAAIQQKYTDLNVEHENLRRQHVDATTQATTLTQAQEEMRKQIEQVKAEKAKLEKAQSQQRLLLERFPNIAQFAHFIPAADDDEVFLKNAEAFASTLSSYVDNGARQLVQGATPPAPPQTPKGTQESIGEQLYNKVTRLAGVVGKESEYETALQEWIAFSNNHK